MVNRWEFKAGCQKDIFLVLSSKYRIQAWFDLAAIYNRFETQVYIQNLLELTKPEQFADYHKRRESGVC